MSITSSSPLTGKVALLPGASQGIGAGIALEFARRHASLIILIGRNEVLLKGVKEQAEEIGGGETKVEYIVADLSLTRKVKEALMQVVEILDGKKIDYIIETQGATPNGIYQPTSDGLDRHFSVQVLSRFSIPYLLLHPTLISPSLSNDKSLLSDKVGLQIVCSPGGPKSGDVDVEDLDLGKKAVKGDYGKGIRDMGARLNADGVELDCFVMEFNDRYPILSSSNIYPGILPTSVLTNSAFPFPIPIIMSYLLPILSWLGIINTVDNFAKDSVDMVVEGEKGLFKAKGKRETLGQWENVKENRVEVFAALEKLVVEGR